MVTDYSFYDLADVVHVTRLSYHSLALSHIYDNLKQITWYEEVVASLSLITKPFRIIRAGRAALYCRVDEILNS